MILTNAGAAYSVAPSIRIIGGGGSGAIATCGIETVQKGVISYTVTESGSGYTVPPTVTVASPGTGTTAIPVSVVDSSNTTLQTVRAGNPGIGYTVVPTVTVADPNIITGRGNFEYNDLVVGQTSNTEARVRSWDLDTKILKIANVGIGSTVSGFIPGEEVRVQTGIGVTGLKIHKTTFVAGFTTTNVSVSAGTTNIFVGSANTSKFNIGDDIEPIDNVIGAGVTVHSVSGTGGTLRISESTLNTSFKQGLTLSIGSTEFVAYNISQYDNRDIYDDFSSNDEFELEADEIIDFAETNPFGTY